MLAQIVEMIQKGYPISDELKEYANSLEKKELKPQVNIKAEANTKIIEGKVTGVIVKKKSKSFEVKIDGKTYVVKRAIQEGIDINDKIEIDGYEIVIGNNISINKYSKV